MKTRKCIVVIDGPDKIPMFYGYGKFHREYPEAEHVTFNIAMDLAIKWGGKAIKNYGMEDEIVAYDSSWRTEADRQAEKLGLDDTKDEAIDKETWEKVADAHNEQLRKHRMSEMNPFLKLVVGAPPHGKDYAVILMNDHGKEIFSDFNIEKHDRAVSRAHELIKGSAHADARWAQVMVKRNGNYEIIESMEKESETVEEEQELKV